MPAALPAAIAALGADVQAALPLEQATTIQLSYLQTEATSVLGQAQAALAATGAPLDAGDPTCFAGALPDALNALAGAASDQAVLSNAVGLLGRSLLNISRAAGF